MGRVFPKEAPNWEPVRAGEDGFHPVIVPARAPLTYTESVWEERSETMLRLVQLSCWRSVQVNTVLIFPPVWPPNPLLYRYSSPLLVNSSTMLLDSPETVPLVYRLKMSFHPLLVELRFFRSKLTVKLPWMPVMFEL